MKKVLLFVLFSFFCFESDAQTGITILFETQYTIKEESLKSLPAYIRANAIKQSESIKEESYMSIQDNKVYFEIKLQVKEKTNKGMINTNGTAGDVLFAKDLSVSKSYSAVKLIKDYETNTYVKKINNDLVTEKLQVVQWKFTNKKKVILGYSCYEAVALFNKQQLTVYFTEDLKVVGSPSYLPFINGVVLAYTYGNNIATAVKVETNQTLISNFL
ncbi:GLPGLI family protein [Flavobacterium sp. K5-23]|uniref:GLPGLI family protein n=1 Tax=Flavobacterium sp. K5-23 TaxID=2746225 RepID=UPI00200F64C9|nr:GLPGLI family protein [Flavobacterium sp. K5-23]UQD55232.1 GLPGLI family protein [Flavobacterium sp. K5-23]